MICHYWYLLNKFCRYESTVCNGIHDVLMMAFGLENIAIPNIKVADFRCIILNMSGIDAISRLNNSIIDDHSSL